MTLAPRNICRLSAVLTLMLGSGAFTSDSLPSSVGSMAPTFSTESLDGGTLALESLRGSVVLLNFWAVECPPCRIEMPELERLHRRYSTRGLRVLGVTEMDPPREQIFRAVAEIGVTYRILLDPGARIGSLYGIEAHPTSLVVDATGIVRFVNTGYLKGEERGIEEAIRKALAKNVENPRRPHETHGDEP